MKYYKCKVVSHSCRYTFVFSIGLLSSTAITQQTIIIVEHPYAEVVNNNENLSILFSLEAKPVGNNQNNFTQLMNQHNNSKMRDIESGFNNTLVFKNQFKNEASFLSSSNNKRYFGLQLFIFNYIILGT